MKTLESTCTGLLSRRQAVAYEQRQHRLMGRDLSHGAQHLAVIVEVHQYAVAENDVERARGEFRRGFARALH